MKNILEHFYVIDSGKTYFIWEVNTIANIKTNVMFQLTENINRRFYISFEKDILNDVEQITGDLFSVLYQKKIDILYTIDDNLANDLKVLFRDYKLNQLI